MIRFEPILDFAAGCVCLTVGVRFIASRRAEIGENDDLWVHGWRAVLVGCMALAAGALSIAAALGYIHIDLG